MKSSHLLMLLLCGVMYGGQVVAVEAVKNTEQAATVDQQTTKKVKKHPKKCIDKEGKPCHPKAQKAAAGGQEVKPAVLENSTPAKAAQGVAAAPAVAAAAAKPEPKVEPAVSAADAVALAKKNNCFVCHAVDKKMVGPGWRDVAAKYRGDAAAEARLVIKIAKGGGGVWGSMAMPAQPQISEADRRTLAKYVLNLQ